jgi:endoglucanase Acf2
LALIADNLGITDARQQALSNLEQWIIPWLQGMNSEPLVYDKVYGGLVSAQGLTDMVADFGAGWYNDHHFQFGYFVNAIAVLAKLDLPFYEANKAALDTFVRDICNPDATDTDFPFVRHKDLFDGHSWASGIFQQGNGKGQESSSEVGHRDVVCLCMQFGAQCANKVRAIHVGGECVLRGVFVRHCDGEHRIAAICAVDADDGNPSDANVLAHEER